MDLIVKGILDKPWSDTKENEGMFFISDCANHDDNHDHGDVRRGRDRDDDRDHHDHDHDGHDGDHYANGNDDAHCYFYHTSSIALKNQLPYANQHPENKTIIQNLKRNS